MHHHELISYQRFLLLLAVFVPVSSLLIYIAWRFDESVVYDGYLVENLQVAFLLLASFMHIKRCRPLYGANQHNLELYIRIFLAFLCVAFAIRELDIKDFGDRLTWQPIEMSIRIVIGAGFLVYILFLLNKTPFFWRQKMVVFASPLFQLAFAGCLFYLLGWPFDKKVFESLSFAQSQMLEEILEFQATVFLLAAAWWPRSIIKKS